MPSPTDPRPVALVTGAAGGLGQAITRRLHADGFRVAATDVDHAAAEALAAELDGSGELVLGAHLDVASCASMEEALAMLAARWAAPSVLVNNASLTTRTSLWEISEDEWDQVLATNLRSYFFLSRACAGPMRERGHGRIVNISSFAGQQGGLVAGAHYSASKAGSLVLTKVFARELAASGVTVNAVAPAAVRTPAMTQDEADALCASIPVGRVGRSEEVAAAVAYLVGPGAGFVTGATLDVNGGLAMR